MSFKIGGFMRWFRELAWENASESNSIYFFSNGTNMQCYTMLSDKLEAVIGRVFLTKIGAYFRTFICLALTCFYWC